MVVSPVFEHDEYVLVAKDLRGWKAVRNLDGNGPSTSMHIVEDGLL